MWENLNLAKMEQCVVNKAELDKVFPGFIYALEQRVNTGLGGRYPGMQSWYGPNGRQKMLEMHPELADPIYLDWVCFGIEGQPVEACHVGVLFDLTAWPLQYRIGIHAFDGIWQPAEEALKAARQALDGDFIYQHAAAFGEHQFNDLPKVLDLNSLEAELDNLGDRVSVLYDAFNPLLKQ